MAHEGSHSKPQNLTYDQRQRIFDKTVAKVKKYYFDPAFNGTNWPSLAEPARDKILALDDPEQFELGVHDLLRKLGTSHTGFFHQSVRRVPGRLAIGASFRKAEMAQGPRWVVQDVHPGGPADLAGLKPLDVLGAINGKNIVPPEQPMFPMGTTVAVTVERGGTMVPLSMEIPLPRSRKQPYSEPKPVIHSKLGDSIGYLKIAILPGLIGIDVAKEILRAAGDFSECDRLILDLRGHVGGGLGVLRLMSLLSPGKIPIGYTVTRRCAERGYTKERLRTLDRIPSSKLLGIPLMILRYAVRDESVVLVTEGLGPRKFHGRIVILANEHTVSAGEMVCAFAQENRLATIVGTETAGRLIPGSGFKVGHGYMVILPKAAYITWHGNRFEGHGVKPDVEVAWSPERFAEGHDNQLEAAVEVVKRM